LAVHPTDPASPASEKHTLTGKKEFSKIEQSRKIKNNR